VETWGLDGTKYIDMSTGGIGARVLGFSDPDVNDAVRAMLRYARGGAKATAVGVRIARAGTGRERIAFCGYHGWHDWYVSANLAQDDALDGHLLHISKFSHGY